MTHLANVVVNTLISLDGASRAPAAFRPALYEAELVEATHEELIAVVMVLAEGNRHGPDAARDLAGRL